MDINENDNNNTTRPLSYHEGQDWLLNRQNNILEDEIKDIKEIYGFTIRLDEALLPNATSFRDFDNTMVASLWQTAFQLFLFLGETVSKRLNKVVEGMRGDMVNDNTVQFYLEAVLDSDKYYEDKVNTHSKTSVVAYTFWMFIKNLDRNDLYFDIPKLWNGIIQQAMAFTEKAQGENGRIAVSVTNAIDEEMEGEEDPMEAEEDNSSKKKKKKERTKNKVSVKDLNKHELWKLIQNKEQFAFLFDMLTHGEELQTLRLDELTHRPAAAVNNPAHPSTLFNPAIAFYARPRNCIPNQSFFHIDKVFQKVVHRSGRVTYNVKFPMKKYTYKIPISTFTVKSIIERKVPLYQFNSKYSFSKMQPVTLDRLDSIVNDSYYVKALKEKGQVSNKGKSTWESQYEKYKRAVDRMKGIETAPDLPPPLVNSDGEESESDDMITEVFRNKLMKMALNGQLTATSGESTEDIVNEVLRRNEESIKERERYRCANATAALNDIMKKAEMYGVGDVFSKALKARGGMINKLMTSQLVNCTTLWAEGTNTSDSKGSDYYKYISVYAMLAHENEMGRKAIANIERRIRRGDTCATGISNPTEVSRKLLRLLKKHMLKQFMNKCMSTDAYGISPYERAVIAWMKQENLLEKVVPRIVHTKFDRSLGLVSNWLCRLAMKLQTTLNIADPMIREAMLVLICKADSTRLEHDLHTHVVFFSTNGGNGKSHISELAIEYSIPGTAKSEGFKSTKSDVTNQNLNGAIIVLPEIQQSLLSDNDPKNEQARMFKDSLTSSITTGTRLEKTPNGSYEPVSIRGENIRTLIGSTNVNMYKLTGAMKSRIHSIYVEQSSNPLRGILEAKGAEKMSSRRLILEKAEFKTEEICASEALLMQLDRIRFVGGIDSVTADVAWIFMMVLKRVLLTRGINIDNVRKSERFVAIARQFCWRDTFEKVWFHRGAIYNGKPVNFEDQCEELDRKLFVTTEHIVAAIGLAYDTIINPHMDIVRRCIRELFKESEGEPRFKSVHTMCQIHSGRQIIDVKLNVPDYNWMRFNTFIGGTKAFYKKISDMSKRLDGKSVSVETVEDAIENWINCRVECPFYAYKGQTKVKGRRDENDEYIEERDLSEIKVVPDKKLSKKRPVIDIYQKNIYFCYHYFMSDDIKDQITELKESILTILNAAHQLEGKFVFNNNMEFPFVMDIIEAKESNGEFISLPALNLVKQEMKMVMNEAHFIANTKYKSNSTVIELQDHDYQHMIDNFEEGYQYTDDTYNPDESNDISMSEYDVSAIGWDLNTYGLMQRNKQLKYTDKPINGDYARFNLFSGLGKKVIPKESMSEDDVYALAFEEDMDYNRQGGGYFMGEELDNIMKAETLPDLEEIAKNLTQYYQILDKVDDSIVDPKTGFVVDDDFNPENYIVYQRAEDGTMKKMYHWECLTGQLSKMQNYKLLREHPKIINDFLDRRNADLNIGTNCYPEKIIEQYKASKKGQQDVINTTNIYKKKDLVANVQEKKLHIDGYISKKNDKGEVVDLDVDSNNPYRAIEMEFGKRRTTLDMPPPPRLANKVHSQINSMRKGMSYEQMIAPRIPALIPSDNTKRKAIQQPKVINNKHQQQKKDVEFVANNIVVKKRKFS